MRILPVAPRFWVALHPDCSGAAWRDSCERRRPRSPALGRSWELRYALPDGPDGKRRTATATFRGNKKAAQAKLRELMSAADKGEHVAKVGLTVGDLLRQRIETWQARGKITRAPRRATRSQQHRGADRRRSRAAAHDRPHRALAPHHAPARAQRQLDQGGARAGAASARRCRQAPADRAQRRDRPRPAGSRAGRAGDRAECRSGARAAGQAGGRSVGAAR